MDYFLVRMMCSFMVGVLLSQAGSLVQLGTRNILASPSTLGFDGLAVLWLLIFHLVSLYFNLNLPIEWTFVLGIPEAIRRLASSRRSLSTGFLPR